MNLRLVAWALLLMTLLGVFGCTAGVDVPMEDDIIAEEPNFIGGKSDALSETGSQYFENLLNFAATDANGVPLFQIVYKLGADEWVKAECVNLATAIYEVTGVTVPIVHSMEKQKEYEILVGDIARAEIVDVRDQYAMDEDDYLIKVVDTRVMVFSRNELAVISGLMYLTSALAYRNAESQAFGLAEDFELLQQTSGEGETSVISTDANYVELKVPYSAMLYTYVRLSYTGNNGWRIQSKFDETDVYKDEGASQRLARTLGEAPPSHLEKIETYMDGDVLMAEAANKSRVEIHLKDFRMDFYTSSNHL
ncbi:MAG: hypothetical protein IJX80_08040, partial [Clostridia bacterium]|nr:hypothetical protein [Clostridia bacterium]